MVHKSKVANTKKAEKPLAQTKCYLQELVPRYLTKIPFDQVT